MAGEDVQVQGSQDSIPQAVLLDQEARVRAGQRCVPRAPFIHHQRDFLLRVVLIHDRRLLRHQVFHLQRGFEDPAVLGCAESNGRKGRRPLHYRVGVQREPIDIPTPVVSLVRLHDGVGPLGAGVARADRDLEHLPLAILRRIEVPDEAAVDLELAEIVVHGHVAAAGPAFVADAEIGDLVGSGMAIRRALLGQRGRLVGGQVFQPFRGLLWSAGAHID